MSGTARGPSQAVAAVVVTYRPDAAVSDNLRAVLAQVDRAIVVDNGSPADAVAAVARALDEAPDRSALIRNADNQGLAAAQNAGIRAALDWGADFVLLLDQDSRPEPGMVPAMLAALAADSDPASIGLLAPNVQDADQTRPTRYLISRDGAERRIEAFGTAPVLDGLLFAIASGSLIPAAVLGEVGGMRDDFFIDYVDVEFSLRLRRHGYRILAVRGARLRHRLGAYEERKLLWRTVAVTHHSALRRYYQYRNRVRTLRLYGAACPAFVRWEVRSMLADMVRLLCFERQRPSKLWNILRGALDGIRTRPT